MLIQICDKRTEDITGVVYVQRVVQEYKYEGETSYGIQGRQIL